ncbi:MAG: DUF262 domain-containing protein [Mycoplasmatales bacterium]
MKKLGTNILSYISYYQRNLSGEKKISSDIMVEGSDSTKRQRLEILLTLGIIKKEDNNFIDVKNKFDHEIFLNYGYNQNGIYNTLKNKIISYKYYTESAENKESNFFDYKDEYLLIEGIMIAMLFHNGKKEEITNFYLENKSEEIEAIKYYNLNINDEELIKLSNSIIFPNDFILEDLILNDNDEKINLEFKKVDENIVDSEIYTLGKFTKLLKNENFEIKIPVYQREYLWTKEKALNLFINIMEEEIVNLNTVTFKKQSKTPSSFTLTVIDGQQRITTMLLMLRCCYDSINEIIKIKQDNLNAGSVNTSERDIEKLYQLSKLLSQNFFEFNEKNEIIILANYKRVEGDNTFNSFYNVMNGKEERFNKKRSNHPLENYKAIRRNIENNYTSFKDLKLIVDKLLNSIYFAVTFDSITNEMKLFETLNTTGIPLTSLDLMKCNLFSLIKTNDLFENESSIQKMFTEKISNKIGEKSTDIEKFIRVYLRYKDRLKKDKTLFENFKSTVNAGPGELTLSEITCVFEEIEEIIDIYNYINGKNNDYSIYKIYDFTKTLDREIYFPILIYYIVELKNDKIKINNVRNILFEIEKFEIIFQICNYRGQSLSDKLDQVLSDLKTNLEQSADMTSQILNKDDVFSTSLKIPKHVFISEVEKFAFTEKLVKKLLIRIVNYLYNNNKIELLENDNLISYNSLSAEHIMPKEAKKWLEAKVITQKDHLKGVERLGNFALLEKKLNSKLSNDLFRKKMDALEEYTHIKTDYTLNKNGENGFEVLNLKNWNKQSIDERNKFLASLSADIWIG